MTKGYYYTKDVKSWFQTISNERGMLEESKEWIMTPDNTKIENGEEIIVSHHAEYISGNKFTVGIEVAAVPYLHPHVLVYGSLFLTNRRVIFCTPWERYHKNFAFNLDRIGELEDEWEFGSISFKFKDTGGAFSEWMHEVVLINDSIRVCVPSAKEFADYLNGPFIEERKKSLEKRANELLDSQTDTDSLLGAATNYKILGMGEKFDECITKLALKCERLQDFDNAIDYYKIINSEDDIIRLRKQKSNKVKVDQTVVHGDYVDDRDTIVKDSVINRSNVGAGSDDKIAKLEKIAEMKDKGIIDDDEFKQMKKEILGK